MGLIKVNMYNMINKRIHKSVAIIDTRFINMILFSPADKTFDYSIDYVDHYTIYLSSGSIAILPEDMQPIWNAIGMNL